MGAALAAAPVGTAHATTYDCSGPFSVAISGNDGSSANQPVGSAVQLTVLGGNGNPMGQCTDSDGYDITYSWSASSGGSGGGNPFAAWSSSPGSVAYTVTMTQQYRYYYWYTCGFAQCQGYDVDTWTIGSASVTVGFYDPGPSSVTINVPPVLTAGTAASFTESHQSAVPISQWSWDFGDGTGSNVAYPSHTYGAAGDYGVSLLLTDQYGASAFTSAVVHVSAPLEPAFTMSTSTVDLGQPLHLDASSSTDDPSATISSYQWDFGDGSTGSGETLSHLFTTTGTYSVTLTESDSLGRSASTSQSVTVRDTSPGADAAPTASWTTTTGVVADAPTGFDGASSVDPDGTIVSYSWTFGDGGTATAINPTHVYASKGDYPVTLTVTDNAGQTGSSTQVVTVQDAPPTAVFSSSPSGPVAASVVTFDGSGSSDPDGSISQLQWDFGDWTAATGATPTHTYARPGTYTVTLTVTDDGNQGASATHTITVADAVPTASIALAGSPEAGSDLGFDGTASSDPDGAITAYAWSFGDGTSASGWGPHHTYAHAGTYQVTLTVTDDGGLTASTSRSVVIADVPPRASFTVSATPTATYPVSFDGSGSSDPDGQLVGYHWDFGDGSTGHGPTSSHAYSTHGSYLVTLTVTDDAGLTSASTQTVVVADAAPTAAFTFSPAQPVAASGVAFDGSSSADRDGTVTNYTWYFGDSYWGSGPTPTHAYARSGWYTVSLTVTDDAGLTTTASRTVEVADAPPTSSFTASTLSPTVGSTVGFDGRGSTDADGTVGGYSWSFGDGTTATGATTSHTWTAPGTYAVSLTVADDAGLTATSTQNVVVSYGNADLGVSLAGATAKNNTYTYSVTVRNAGPSAAQSVVLSNTLDSTETLAASPVVPTGVTCSGVGVGATGTLTCMTASLASGASFVVKITVTLPSPSRAKSVSETSRVSASNPDPQTANNTVTLKTGLPVK